MINENLFVNLIRGKSLKCHIFNNDYQTGVYSVQQKLEYKHEERTAISLTGWGFLPNGYFHRHDKKFDVFLCYGHIFFECDLKCITSTNPDTIGKRIKNGSEQASRLVLDIQSGISSKELIEGLKSGCTRNELLKEIMLIYKSKFYRLFKQQILSDRIFDILK